jgi:amino acid transporter
MITSIFIGIIVSLISTVFSMLPTVTTLPTIAGYDVDGALVTGMGEFTHFIQDVWPIYDVFLGFLVLMGYFGIKMLLKAVLGSRAPGSYE